MTSKKYTNFVLTIIMICLIGLNIHLITSKPAWADYRLNDRIDTMNSILKSNGNKIVSAINKIKCG